MSHTAKKNRQLMGKRGRVLIPEVRRVNQISARRPIPGVPHIDENAPAQLGHRGKKSMPLDIEGVRLPKSGARSRRASGRGVSGGQTFETGRKGAKPGYPWSTSKTSVRGAPARAKGVKRRKPRAV